jgi:hypothetical protein
VDVVGVVGAASRASTRGEAALLYARAGLAVLPCAAGRKRPLTRAGLRDASTDLSQVAAWWRRWPAANVGVVTGGAGVDVLDIDRRADGSGFDVVAATDRAGLSVGWVCRVATPSGGEHRYYPAVTHRPQRCWARTRVHVDFRGTGGYVLVPPSTIRGVGPYRLLRENLGGEPRPLDAAALRSHLDPPPQPRPASAGSVVVDGSMQSRLAAWVAGRPEGARNEGLFWAACRFAEADVAQGDAHDVLGAAAAAAGLPAPEVLATIRSAYRTALPGAQPPRPSASPRQGRGLGR